VPELSKALLAGATSNYALGGAAGITAALLTYAGIRIWKDHQARQKDPVKFLSTVEKKTEGYDTLTTSPLGLSTHQKAETAPGFKSLVTKTTEKKKK